MLIRINPNYVLTYARWRGKTLSMAGWTMKELRAKARQMLADPAWDMDQKGLCMAIELGQSSMSRFMNAQDDEIPSIDGDAILRLVDEVVKWEGSLVGAAAVREEPGLYGGAQAADLQRLEAALAGLLAVIRSDLKDKEKGVAAQDFFRLYAPDGNARGVFRGP